MDLGLSQFESLIIIAADPSKHDSTQAPAYIKNAHHPTHLTMSPVPPTSSPAPPPPSPVSMSSLIDQKRQLGEFLVVCGFDVLLIFL